MQSVTAPLGTESADASSTTVYVADRAKGRVVALDIASDAIVAVRDVPGVPDYVRFSPATSEVWVSIPAANRLEILDAGSLAAIGSVTLPAPPEGLTIEGERAYANANGRMIAIDVARRLVIGEWDTGCGYLHGFPQVDDTYHLAFGGCFLNGGVGVVTMQGEPRAGFEGAELRYSFLREIPGLHPLARFALSRDVTIQTQVRAEVELAASYALGPFQVEGDAGAALDVNFGHLHSEMRPGIGANVRVTGELRLGAELHAELTHDAAATSWVVLGPDVAWTRGRFWLAGVLGVGIRDITMAPRLNLGMVW